MKGHAHLRQTADVTKEPHEDVREPRSFARYSIEWGGAHSKAR